MPIITREKKEDIRYFLVYRNLGKNCRELWRPSVSISRPRFLISLGGDWRSIFSSSSAYSSRHFSPPLSPARKLLFFRLGSLVLITTATPDVYCRFSWPEGGEERGWIRPREASGWRWIPETRQLAKWTLASEEGRRYSSWTSLVTRENCNHLDDDYLLFKNSQRRMCWKRERQLLSPFPYHRLNGSSGVYRRIHLLESARYIVVPAAHRTYNWLTPGNKVSRGSSFRYLRNEQAPGDIVTITSSLDTYPLFEVLFTH